MSSCTTRDGESLPSDGIPGIFVTSYRDLSPVQTLSQTFNKEINNCEVIVNKNLDSSKSDDHMNVDYPTAVNFLGTGKFHFYLALICGYVFLAAGLQNNLNAYILPAVRCDLSISFSQMGLLNALFLAGGIASSFLWGLIADSLGRRTVILYGMCLDGILTLCSSLSQSYLVLLTFRFFNGFVVGGPSSIVLTYMGEFFPDHKRTKVICYVGVSWTLSWVIMPAMAWLVIPKQWSVTWWGLNLNSWRLLVALTAVPSLSSAAILLYFPESPMYVLVHGDRSSALSIMAGIYALNHGALYDYPVKSLKDQSSILHQNSNLKSSSANLLFWRIKQLFTFPVTYITVLTIFLFFSNMFGYYGLGLWLPELFHRMSSQQLLYPESHPTLCYTSTPQSNDTSLRTSGCDPTNMDPSVFTKSVIMGTVGLLGNIVSGAMVGRCHRRTMPVVLMTLSGLFILVLYYTSNMTLNLVVASAFQLTINTANLVYNALVVDMFPSNISGMGVSMAILAGRLGAMVSNIVFGLLIDISCSFPIFLCVAVMFAGSIASFYIPEKPFGLGVSSNSQDVLVRMLSPQSEVIME